MSARLTWQEGSQLQAPKIDTSGYQVATNALGNINDIMKNRALNEYRDKQQAIADAEEARKVADYHAGGILVTGADGTTSVVPTRLGTQQPQTQAPAGTGPVGVPPVPGRPVVQQATDKNGVVTTTTYGDPRYAQAAADNLANNRSIGDARKLVDERNKAEGKAPRKVSLEGTTNPVMLGKTITDVFDPELKGAYSRMAREKVKDFLAKEQEGNTAWAAPRFEAKKVVEADPQATALLAEMQKGYQRPGKPLTEREQMLKDSWAESINKTVAPTPNAPTPQATQGTGPAPKMPSTESVKKEVAATINRSVPKVNKEALTNQYLQQMRESVGHNRLTPIERSAAMRQMNTDYKEQEKARAEAVKDAQDSRLKEMQIQNYGAQLEYNRNKLAMEQRQDASKARAAEKVGYQQARMDVFDSTKTNGDIGTGDMAKINKALVIMEDYGIPSATAQLWAKRIQSDANSYRWDAAFKPEQLNAALGGIIVKHPRSNRMVQLADVFEELVNDPSSVGLYEDAKGNDRIKVDIPK